MTAELLVCHPMHFEVTYKINPWMRPKEWQLNKRVAAQKEWAKFIETLKYHNISVKFHNPQPGAPDMVFTANAGIVLNGKVLLARFKYAARILEQPFFEKTFNRLVSQGELLKVNKFPPGMIQEGAGDCLWDDYRQIFWMGYGPRSDKSAREYISNYFDQDVLGLQLETDEFYHLDTCFCPLSRGHILYYPAAFSIHSIDQLEFGWSTSHQPIPVSKQDARDFALNCVSIDDKVIMSKCSKELELRLNHFGYEVIRTPVPTFKLAGGSVKCLTLRLDYKTHD